MRLTRNTGAKPRPKKPGHAAYGYGMYGYMPDDDDEKDDRWPLEGDKVLYRGQNPYLPQGTSGTVLEVYYEDHVKVRFLCADGSTMEVTCPIAYVSPA